MDDLLNQKLRTEIRRIAYGALITRKHVILKSSARNFMKNLQVKNGDKKEDMQEAIARLM